MRRAVLPAILAVLALLAALAAGADRAARAAPPARVDGQASSGIQVQNLDLTDAATVVAEYRRHDAAPGIQIGAWHGTVPAGSAMNFYSPSIPELAPDVYGVRIAADRPTDAVVRNEWLGSSAAMVYNALRPATDVVLPLYLQRWRHHDGAIAVMNGADAEAAVDLTLWTADGTLARRDQLTLPPHGPTILPLHLSNPPGIGFAGWARLRSTTPIAAVGLADVVATQKAAYAYEGMPAADLAPTLYAPLVRRTTPPQRTESVTYLWVTNPGDGATQVTVRYTGTAGACAGRTYTDGPHALPAHAMRRFDPRAPGAVPPNCAAAATITAAGPIAAVAVDEIDDRAAVAAYTALPATAGADRVALVLVRWAHTPLKFMAATAVQNVGAGPARVEFRVRDQNGVSIPSCGSACTVTIPAGGGHVFQPSNALQTMMPANSYGSAELVSDQPVVAVVLDASETGGHDAAIFAGIALPAEAPLEPLLAPFVVNRSNVSWRPWVAQRFFPWADAGR